MTAHTRAYRYLAPSAIGVTAQPRLQLATSDTQGALLELSLGHGVALAHPG
ncbi:hypothetical protein [Massilia rubra]|uniref:hypothetical protein n=1 Tax=Massilia rubra TaxID=2607910 RepID=UPI00141D8BB6|nr:hypothetical protein [Massilia rubra]